MQRRWSFRKEPRKLCWTCLDRSKAPPGGSSKTSTWTRWTTLKPLRISSNSSMQPSSMTTKLRCQPTSRPTLTLQADVPANPCFSLWRSMTRSWDAWRSTKLSFLLKFKVGTCSTVPILAENRNRWWWPRPTRWREPRSKSRCLPSWVRTTRVAMEFPTPDGLCDPLEKVVAIALTMRPWSPSLMTGLIGMKMTMGTMSMTRTTPTGRTTSLTMMRRTIKMMLLALTPCWTMSSTSPSTTPAMPHTLMPGRDSTTCAWPVDFSLWLPWTLQRLLRVRHQLRCRCSPTRARARKISQRGKARTTSGRHGHLWKHLILEDVLKLLFTLHACDVGRRPIRRPTALRVPKQLQSQHQLAMANAKLWKAWPSNLKAAWWCLKIPQELNDLTARWWTLELRPSSRAWDRWCDTSSTWASLDFRSTRSSSRRQIAPFTLAAITRLSATGQSTCRSTSTTSLVWSKPLYFEVKHRCCLAAPLPKQLDWLWTSSTTDCDTMMVNGALQPWADTWNTCCLWLRTTTLPSISTTLSLTWYLKMRRAPTTTSMSSRSLKRSMWLMMQSFLKVPTSSRPSSWSLLTPQCWPNNAAEAYISQTLRDMDLRQPRQLWEVYCGESRMTKIATSLGMDAQHFGLNNGWNFSYKSHQREFMKLLDEHQPEEVFLSPTCGPWSPMQNIMPRRRSVKSNFNNYETGITEFICVFAEESTWSRSMKADMHTWNSQHLLCHGAPAHCQPCQVTVPSSANASMALCARTTTSNGCQSERTQLFWQRSWPWPKPWIDNVLEIINIAVLKVHFVDFKCIAQPTWRTTSPLWHQLLRQLWQHLKPHTTGNMATPCKRSPSTLASSWNSMSKASLQPFELCRSSTETLVTLQRHLWLNFWAPEVRVQMFYKLLVPMFVQHVSVTRNPIKLHHLLWPKATTSTNDFKLMFFGSKMVTRSLRFFHALTLPPSIRLQPWCLMRKPPTW